MKAIIQKYCKKYMVKPIVYKFLTKLLLSALISVVWIRYVNTRQMYHSRNFLGFTLAVVFGTAAWFSFLKLDGFRIAGLPPKKNSRNKPKQSTASIIDHLDTEPDAFAALTDEEKSFCGFLSSFILFVLFLIIAFI